MKLLRYCFTLFIFLFFASCNNVIYTPRSKKVKHQSLPSVALYDRIVDYRLQYDIWPVSKEAMMYKGGKYKTAWDGFEYENYNFKIKDSLHMVFYFYDHKKDVKNLKKYKTGTHELNNFNGFVSFVKENEKIIWKINSK